MENVKNTYKHFIGKEQGVRAYASYQQLLYGASDSLLTVASSRVIPTLRGFFPTGPDVVVDVGAGDGRRTKVLFENLQRRFTKESSLVLVEPSLPMIKLAKSRLEGCLYRVYLQNCEFERATLPEERGIYFFIHSIFAIDVKILGAAIKELCNVGDIVVIFADRNHGVIPRLKSLVDHNGDIGARTTLDEVENVLRDSSLGMTSLDYEITFSAPRGEITYLIDVLADWLTLGRSSLKAQARVQYFRDVLLSESKATHGMYYWSELERV